MKHLPRRTFIRNSTLAGASLAALSPRLFAQEQPVSANESLAVALIGANGMGFSNLEMILNVPGVRAAAICDVDKRVLEAKAVSIERTTGKKPDTFTDFRRLLERKDIDAVIVGTPDHWHCLITTMACEAGKDVYCEKPLANTIEETDVMVQIARRTGRVVQVGQWQRSDKHWYDAIQFVHSGQLGRVRTVHAFAYIGWAAALRDLPDTEAPEWVDYDMWLGPAPKRPYNRNRFHGDFRWFWDYAGGLMTDWGVHLLDFALFGMKDATPRSVVASGGKMAYPDDPAETPDTMTALYEFEDFNLTWEHMAGVYEGPLGNYHGVTFTGENGVLRVNRDGWEVTPDGDAPDWIGTDRMKMDPVPFQAGDGQGHLNHMQNWVDCIKTRERPRADIEIGANIARVAHLGNIAYRTGRKIHWNAEKGRIEDDREARKLAEADYRKPWKLPKA